MARTLTQWTIADYHRMIAAGLLAERQVELLEGNIIDMAPELPIHRAAYRRSVRHLDLLLGDRAVVFATAPITLPNRSEPQPDICIVRPPESRYDQRHPEPADIFWLIEVSNSTAVYDLGEKANLYARAQILEYWVIDLPKCKLWVHRQPGLERYQDVKSFNAGELSPLAFPQVKVEVEHLLKS
ncbi:MAG: Uma2 family endonuclease [Leptolyngbyaceae cyanobacterium SM1_1_3]|nr:Uma2 family endonuclease [Leptolyngbyaceae cyanobacterium SM1_1_3]NJN01864.1 Uma2 family endonuclease [Leptolyngbyaceae cyanobacterium RM1_1_2]NJO12085.1 Uma2 family endonuclease [Leptolyngbyaceae cyanobacterium SL_1_1]